MTPAASLEQLMNQQEQHRIELEGVKRRIDLAQQRLDKVENELAERRAFADRAHAAGYVNGGPKPSGE